MKVIHGGNREEISRKTGVDADELIDFSANINPLGLSSKLARVIQQAIPDVIYYPNPKYPELKHAIASHYEVNDDDVFVGNGAVQMIFDTAVALKSKTALVLAPTFGEYERSLSRAGAKVEHYILSPINNFQVNVDHLLDYLMDHSQIDLICLCNPNNPTGQVIAPEKVQRLAKYCRTHQIWLILDEAFMDFVAEDSLSYLHLLDPSDPVIIIRSATKFFAIPGLRLGFAMTKNESLKQQLSTQSEPWSVNTLAQKFGEHMYEDQAYIDRTYDWLQQEKDYLYQQLQMIPYLSVYPSKVNYYLLKSKVPNLREKLWPLKIMIRDCSDYYELGSKYYRVAVRSHQENEQLIAALKKLTANVL